MSPPPGTPGLEMHAVLVRPVSFGPLVRVPVGLVPFGTRGWGGGVRGGGRITGSPLQEWNLGSQLPSRPTLAPTKPKRLQVPKRRRRQVLGLPARWNSAAEAQP